MTRRDPRATTRYALMGEIIDFLKAYGACDLEYICTEMDLSSRNFRAARYSLAGRLAMEDRNVTIPRPVSGEGYLYKLASTFRSGDIETDSEPGLLAAVTDILTRQATIYVDVEKFIATLPSGKTKKLFRKVQKAQDTTLDRMEDAAIDTGAPISAWAQTVLDRIQ